MEPFLDKIAHEAAHLFGAELFQPLHRGGAGYRIDHYLARTKSSYYLFPALQNLRAGGIEIGAAKEHSLKNEVSFELFKPPQDPLKIVSAYGAVNPLC